MVRQLPPVVSKWCGVSKRLKGSKREQSAALGWSVMTLPLRPQARSAVGRRQALSILAGQHQCPVADIELDLRQREVRKGYLLRDDGRLVRVAAHRKGRALVFGNGQFP